MKRSMNCVKMAGMRMVMTNLAKKSKKYKKKINMKIAMWQWRKLNESENIERKKYKPAARKRKQRRKQWHRRQHG